MYIFCVRLYDSFFLEIESCRVQSTRFPSLTILASVGPSSLWKKKEKKENSSRTSPRSLAFRDIPQDMSAAMVSGGFSHAYGVLGRVAGPTSYPSHAIKSVVFGRKVGRCCNRRHSTAASSQLISNIHWRNKKDNRFLLVRSAYLLSGNERAHGAVCYFHAQAIALAFLLRI